MTIKFAGRCMIEAVRAVDPVRIPDVCDVRYDLDVTGLGDGTRLRVPVRVLAGVGTRPCVVVVAGIHGNEADGVLAAHALGASLRPSELRGRLVLVAVANPSAFLVGERKSPVDGEDLNRIFPGNKDGTISHRLAERLYHGVAADANFVASLHGWGHWGATFRHVEYDGSLPTATASRAACVASGFDVICADAWPKGLMVRVCAEAGIPAWEGEVGGGGSFNRENVAYYMARLRSLLQHMGMLAGRPPANDNPRFFRHSDLSAPAGGVWRPAVAPGDRVSAGATLGALLTLHGDEVETIVAPRDCMVASVRTYISALPGDRLLRLFFAKDGP
jgi:predicted deacylase